MPFFFMKLETPRATFPGDATEAEIATMHAHFAYWQALTVAGGPSVVFGPVSDPAAVFGMGVVETEDEAAARALADADPGIRDGLLRPSIFPMRVGGVRPS
jgi:uncharacterized protein YciI